MFSYAQPARLKAIPNSKGRVVSMFTANMNKRALARFCRTNTQNTRSMGNVACFLLNLGIERGSGRPIPKSRSKLAHKRPLRETDNV